jgi:hypothetical protein
MTPAKAAALATAIGTIATFILSYCVDLDDTQAIGSAITTVVGALIALFVPAPKSAAPVEPKGISVSPRYHDGPVEKIETFVEDTKDA